MAGVTKPEEFLNCMVSHDGEPLRAAKNLEITTHFSSGQAPRAEMLIVPIGRSVDQLLDNAAMIARLKDTAQNCAWMTSLCAGALLLKVAGLVDGRRITTQEGVTYVRDGHVVTSAGVLAGIDMAFWLVGVIGGAPFARDVQHQIKYHPAPPYVAET